MSASGSELLDDSEDGPGYRYATSDPATADPTASRRTETSRRTVRSRTRSQSPRTCPSPPPSAVAARSMASRSGARGSAPFRSSICPPPAPLTPPTRPPAAAAARQLQRQAVLVPCARMRPRRACSALWTGPCGPSRRPSPLAAAPGATTAATAAGVAHAVDVPAAAGGAGAGSNGSSGIPAAPAPTPTRRRAASRCPSR